MRSSKRSLLHGRWLYVGLAALVLVLYGTLWLRRSYHRSFRAQLHEAMRDAAGSTPQRMETLEVRSTELLTLLRRKPGVANLIGLWTLLMAGVGLIGVWFNLQAAWNGTLIRLGRYRSRLPRTWSIDELIRMVILLVLVASLLPFVHISLIAWGSLRWMETHLWILVSMMVMYGWLVLLVWGFASSKGMRVSTALGLSRHNAWDAIEQGLVGYLMVFPWIMGLLWGIIAICQWLGIQPPLEPIHELLFEERSPILLGVTVVLACLVGPVVEEIFFRGLLFVALRKRTSRVLAMVISGSLFSAAHTNLFGFVPILLLGCFLADCYERSGSLWGAITVHMFHNTVLIGMALTAKALLSP